MKSRISISDMLGNKYGKLTVLYLTGEKSGTHPKVWARCECGTEKSILATHIRQGRVVSCGCVKLEAATTHGHTSGGKQSSEYNSWRAMMQRCYDENSISYPNYGQRGITVCKRWHAFENFLHDMGLKPSKGLDIERKNNEGNYTKRNCIWTTRYVNNRNRTVSKSLTFKGKCKSLQEWADEYGISYSALYGRLRRKWSAKAALTTPLHNTK